MLRDLVTDANDLAFQLNSKWYGATNQSDGSKRSRGGIRRLLENCKALAQRMTEYELIMGGEQTDIYSSKIMLIWFDFNGRRKKQMLSC